MEKDRILSTLRDVIENKKSSKNSVRQALLAYAQVGSKIAPERTMDELSQLLEKKLGLADNFLRDRYTRLQSGVLAQFRFHIDDKKTSDENSLKIICEHLSEEVSARKLSSIVRSGQANNRALALLAIAKLNKHLISDVILDSIKIAIDDKEEIVRLTTLQASESLVEKNTRNDLCILISKRLADENNYIQTKAWEVLLKTYTSLGVWN